MQDQSIVACEVWASRSVRASNEKPARVATHSVEEVTNVVDYLASIDASAVVVVLAGVACGVFPHDAVGGYFSTNDVSTTFVSGGVANEVLPEFLSTALRLHGVVVDGNAWKRARSSAKSRGVALDTYLLRRLWVIGRLSLPRPLAEIIAFDILSLQALKSAVPDLPQRTHAEYDIFLRGA